jgi:hypothetical protein
LWMQKLVLFFLLQTFRDTTKETLPSLSRTF